MIFTSIFLTLLISFVLLINHWGQNKGIVFLVFGILFSSIRLLTFLVINIQSDFEVLALLFLHTDPLVCLAGPAFLFYFRSLIFSKTVFRPAMVWHLLPSILVLINTLSYFFIPFNEKLGIVYRFTVEEGFDLDSLPHLLFNYSFQKAWPPILSLSYYLFFIYWGYKTKRAGSIYIKKRASLVINRVMVIVAINLIPGLLLVGYSSYQASVHSPELSLDYTNLAYKDNRILYLMTLILPISIFLSPTMLYGESDNRNKLGLFYTGVKKLFISEMSVGQKTIPQSDDLDRIILFIEDTKPYLKDNFSLHDISRAINIPHVRVTNCFNKQLKISFPIYRNRLRVQYATSLLRDGAQLHMSIEGIAMKSGFKSISAFYAAFKAEYKMTPIDWIRENL